MRKDIRCISIFLSMILLAPLLFGIAYFLWSINYWVAIAFVFTGLVADLLIGFELLDQLSGTT